MLLRLFHLFRAHSHSQVFSTQQLELSMLWVEEVSGGEAGKFAFNVITPEDRLCFAAGNEIDKEDWMTAISQAVASLVETDDGLIVAMRAGMLADHFHPLDCFASSFTLLLGYPRLSLPVFYDPAHLQKRIGKYNFRAHPFYRSRIPTRSLLLEIDNSIHTTGSARILGSGSRDFHKGMACLRSPMAESTAANLWLVSQMVSAFWPALVFVELSAVSMQPS